MLELMSSFLSLPDHAPLSSYRCGKSVRVVRYGRALGAIKGLVAKSGRNADELALHSLRIGGAITLAAGEDISERVIQREWRCKPDAYKACVITSRIREEYHVRYWWQAKGRSDSRGKEQLGVGNEN